jgi:predicted CxxxxCH...CXXCH cytochrome family protein
VLAESNTSYPGVGAHLLHAYASSTHAAVPCNECHVVPERTDSPGHADDALPAEVVFGNLAQSGGRAPSYDVARRTCQNSSCHRQAQPVWTEPRSSDAACGSCHGLPPPPPHPESAACATCHGDVIDAERHFLRPELHVNGVVEQNSEQPCNSCHGSDNSAPPLDLSGRSDTALPSVGAHQAHLAGSSRARAVACSECHVVPRRVADPGHIDGALPAEVIFSGAASAFGGAPAYAAGACQNTSCHGGAFPQGHRSGGMDTQPLWTAAGRGAVVCGSCHALPPPPPHPYAELNPVCSACHENIAPDNTTFHRPELHVDGIVTFSVE